jgi:hypothetical protein
MGLRKGVFMGCYAPPELKEALQRQANAEHRTLSQEIVKRLKESLAARDKMAVQEKP